MLGRDVDVKRRWWIAVAAIGIVGCGPSEEVQQQLAQLEVVTARQDSLVDEVAEYAQIMSEISSELADVEMEGRELLIAVESPLAASRDSILGKIRYITERMEHSEQRLAQSRRRVRQLTHISDSLRTTLENTISNYEDVLATQRESIETLTDRVTNLEGENERLASEVDTLENELTDARTVYYTIATRKELLERGIIEKKGGSRVLFIFGKRGETLVPCRELDPNQFTAIDSREVSEIPVPDPEATYTIVSRHNIALLENQADDDGRIRGDLRIASPEEFWSASPFLILVSDS